MRNTVILLLVSFLTIGCTTNKTALFGEMEALANQGSPEAQYHLGMFYNNGIGTQKDPVQAFKWFEQSAMAGNPLGSYKLGCYYAGQGQGVVTIDNTEALNYKLVAAKHGYSLAQYDVALSYYEAGDVDEALRWWKMSADQGDPASVYTLYTLYSGGGKCPQDHVMAYGYLKLIERNSRKDQKSEIRENFAELESVMTAEQITQAQEFAKNWTPQRTPLTVKALNGLEESKRLVKEAKNE